MAKPQPLNNEQDLPHGDVSEGWTVARLGELAVDIQPGFACGRHADAATGVPQLRPMNVTRG